MTTSAQQLDPALVAQEQLRQQYLAAMGITPWLPRQVLPGAAPSPQWQWLDAREGDPAVAAAAVSGDESGVVSSRPSAVGVEAARAAMAPLRQSLTAQSGNTSSVQESLHKQPQGSPAEMVTDSAEKGSAEPLPSSRVDKAETAAPLVEQLASSKSVNKDEIPRFKLALVAYAHCLVITELPLRHAQPWSDQHQQLLSAIVAAIGLAERGQRSSHYREFHWPLDPTAGFDQSESVARHALEVELESMRQPGQQALLLMGQSAARYLLPPAQLPEAGVLTELNSQPVVCCHGLNEVLRLPGLKAELWRQLQPLRRLASQAVINAIANPTVDL